jgi:hypothetical protein
MDADFEVVNRSYELLIPDLHVACAVDAVGRERDDDTRGSRNKKDVGSRPNGLSVERWKKRNVSRLLRKQILYLNIEKL